jgi:hypothetical protein
MAKNFPLTVNYLSGRTEVHWFANSRERDLAKATFDRLPTVTSVEKG